MENNNKQSNNSKKRPVPDPIDLNISKKMRMTHSNKRPAQPICPPAPKKVRIHMNYNITPNSHVARDLFGSKNPT